MCFIDFSFFEKEDTTDFQAEICTQRLVLRGDFRSYESDGVLKIKPLLRPISGIYDDDCSEFLSRICKKQSLREPLSNEYLSIFLFCRNTAIGAEGKFKKSV